MSISISNHEASLINMNNDNLILQCRSIANFLQDPQRKVRNSNVIMVESQTMSMMRTHSKMKEPSIQVKQNYKNHGQTETIPHLHQSVIQTKGQ